MQPILRVDADVTCYRVEVKLYEDRGERNWTDAGNNDSFTTKVPARLRWKDRRTGKHKQPFHDFTASGDCWQQHGLHGSFDESRAMRLAELLSKYNPDYRFRVVEHRVMQKRTELASLHRTEGESDDD